MRDNINQIRLCPRTDLAQSTLSFGLTTEPRSDVRSFLDSFGNLVHTFDIPEPHSRLTITADSRVVTRPENGSGTVALPDRYLPLTAADAGTLIDYLQPTRRADFAPPIVALAQELHASADTDSLLALASHITHALHQRFEYVPGATDVGTIASDALAAARGVCQDYTHVMLAVLRVLGVPARYVSGYFHPEGAEGEVGEQASHAWVGVWFLSRGWVGFDPTNDRLVNDRYIRIAVGRDYGDVTPVRGSYRGSESSTMAVDVSVSTGVGLQQMQPQQQQQQ